MPPSTSTSIQCHQSDIQWLCDAMAGQGIKGTIHHHTRQSTLPSLFVSIQRSLPRALPSECDGWVKIQFKMIKRYGNHDYGHHRQEQQEQELQDSLSCHSNDEDDDGDWMRRRVNKLGIELDGGRCHRPPINLTACTPTPSHNNIHRLLLIMMSLLPIWRWWRWCAISELCLQSNSLISRTSIKLLVMHWYYYWCGWDGLSWEGLDRHGGDRIFNG